MSFSPTIQGDAPCQCGYNLRGLTFDHNCPECGIPALKSVRFQMKHRWRDTPEGIAQREKSRAALQKAVEANRHRYPPDAFIFVLDSMRFAAFCQAENREGAIPWTDVGARSVCRALREYARLSCGGEDGATLTLAALAIQSSDDVGNIVYAMVDSGRLAATESDDPSQFVGLFTLENLYEVEL